MSEETKKDISELSGCEALRDLWEVAKDCSIDRPGITGTLYRLTGFVQCSNFRQFMSAATMKCWEERNSKEYPPIMDTEYNNSGDSNNNSNNTSNKKQ